MSTGINDPARCPYCGLFHTTVCPTLKAIEYHPDGSIKRVEFKTPADYPPITPTGPWPVTCTVIPDGPAGLRG